MLLYALLQRSLIYYPMDVPLAQAESQAADLGATPWLDAQGQWQGWVDPPVQPPLAAPAGRALVFHGNAGMALNRRYYAELLAGLNRSGPWDVLIFEYPGYGPRPGAPSEAAFTEAAVQAVDELLERDPRPLLIIGESIGSGVASAVVRDRPAAVAALMLITPFDSLVNVARYHMPYLPARLLLRDRYHNLDALGDYAGPLVVITAGRDTIVPPAFADPLIRQHRGPLLDEVQAEADHNTLHFNPERAPWPAVDAFLSENLRSP
jgi:pimeloyl-ACP methyl ester carboxylesterase